MSSIYEELENATMNEAVIPDTCLSFYEQSLYIADFVYHENTQFLEKLHIQNFKEFEENNGIAPEFINNDILTESAKEKFKKVMGSINDLFNTAGQQFNVLTVNGKKLVNSITPDMIKNCPDDLGKTHTFFDFKKIKFADKAVALMKQINSEIISTKNDPEKIKKVFDKYNGNIFKIVVGISGDAKSFKNVKTFKKFMYTELLGSEVTVDSTYLKKNYNMIKEVVGGSMIPENFKSMWKSQISMVSDTYNEIYDKAYKYHSDPEYSNKMYEVLVNLITDALLAVVHSYSIIMDVYKRMHREYMNILVKVAKANKKVAECYYGDDDVNDIKARTSEADPEAEESENIEVSELEEEGEFAKKNFIKGGKIVRRATIKNGKIKSSDNETQAPNKVDSVKEEDEIDSDVEGIDDDEPEIDDIEEGAINKITMGLKIHPRQDLDESFKKHSYPGLLNFVQKCKNVSDLRYLKRDTVNGFGTIDKIITRLEAYEAGKADPKWEKNIKKMYVDKGIKSSDAKLYKKWLETTFMDTINAKIAELSKIHESIEIDDLDSLSYSLEYAMIDSNFDF